jgi:cobalt-zinc-cadmium efflux system protein
MSSKRHTKVLAVAFIINTLLTIVEYAAGVITGSAAILADGSQNLTDSLVISIAYVCERLAGGPRTSKRTSAHIFQIAAVLNASILMALAVFIGGLAISRIVHPQMLNSTIVIAIGLFSIVINFWAAGLLFTARRDISVTAPYVGLLFSGLSGIGVFASGLISHTWHVHEVDGLAGIIIASLLLLRSSKMLFAALRRRA